MAAAGVPRILFLLAVVAVVVAVDRQSTLDQAVFLAGRELLVLTVVRDLQIKLHTGLVGAAAVQVQWALSQHPAVEVLEAQERPTASSTVVVSSTVAVVAVVAALYLVLAVLAEEEPERQAATHQ